MVTRFLIRPASPLLITTSPLSRLPNHKTTRTSPTITHISLLHLERMALIAPRQHSPTTHPPLRNRVGAADRLPLFLRNLECYGQIRTLFGLCSVYLLRLILPFFHVFLLQSQLYADNPLQETYPRELPTHPSWLFRFTQKRSAPFENAIYRLVMFLACHDLMIMCTNILQRTPFCSPNLIYPGIPLSVVRDYPLVLRL